MICEKEKCTACSACLNICPQNAIIMEKDEYGNIFPSINQDKCTDCGLCKRVCPQLNNNIDFNKSIKAYAMYCKDSNKRKNSSSGGAATLFYENVLQKQGVVYGASNLFGQDEFKFVRITEPKELYKVKGSKYVHCYINTIFKNIKKDLESGKDVLFIGTPCQVGGLKAYLIKEYKNLICVDIICHGVPSQQLLFDELDNIKIIKNTANFISFRNEKRFNITIKDNNDKTIFDKPSREVGYYNNFLEGNIYRDNCYSCKYARRERISDITIGDFWGLDKKSKIYDDENKGISLIIPNTKKGMNLVESIKKECVIEERMLKEAYRENGQLNHPMRRTLKYYIYKKQYPLIGYEKTIQKMILPHDIIKKNIKKVINKITNK